MKTATIVAVCLVCGCALDWTGRGDGEEEDSSTDVGPEADDDSDDAADHEEEADHESADEEQGDTVETDGPTEEEASEVHEPICFDTCNDGFHPARLGRCDDGGSGSDSSECDYGTDCTDCGPRPAEAP